MLSSEKIKHETLSVTKLCLSKGISQSVTHYAQKTLLKKILKQPFENIPYWSESFFGLSFT